MQDNLLFKDRAPWLTAVPVVILLVVSAVMMLGPMFSDRNRLTMMGLFPLFAYLIFLQIKKTCIEIEFIGEEIRIKTQLAERVLNWQQISEVTIQHQKRSIKLKTAAGDFVLSKTFGRMEQLMKHLEYGAAAQRITVVKPQ